MARRHSLWAAAVLLLSTVAVASDIAKEKRWANQIVDALIEGGPVWLTAGEHQFLGIYTEAEPPGSQRGVIILHGIGVHPDWPQVVYPLRTRLAALGWHTLSLQMPILPNDAKASDYALLLPEVAPRIDAGIAFLTERGVEEIALVGHSLGATMAAYTLSTGDHGARALVAIGMPGGIEETEVVNVDLVTKISLPMLDLYGSNDNADVLAAVPLRQQVKGRGSAGPYASQAVEGANHFYDGQEDALVDSVNTWLAATLGGR